MSCTRARTQARPFLTEQVFFFFRTGVRGRSDYSPVGHPSGINQEISSVDTSYDKQRLFKLNSCMRIASCARCGGFVEKKETLREAGLGMVGWDKTVGDWCAEVTSQKRTADGKDLKKNVLKNRGHQHGPQE